MIDRNRELKLEPIAEQALLDWRIHPIWSDIGYCIVGKLKKE